MSHLHKNKAFISLVRAGLWEKEVEFSPTDFDEVFSLGSQQAVVGLVAAGLEHVKVPKDVALRFMSTVLSLEQRNLAMNSFIADLFQRMDAVGIKALLVKGQGIAQCYERPLWRACGDVDLLLDEENYQKAKALLSSIASNVEAEDGYKRHLAMTINRWEVELHGTLRSGLTKRMDAMVDEVQRDSFVNNRVRIWSDGSVDVTLPAPNNDVILVFSHILQHFFNGGIGLRQICDWCRLLWTFRDVIDCDLLDARLRKMGVMSEWKVFSALAVEWLGMPVGAMPFYSSTALIQWKARWVLGFVLETGNLGHNRDLLRKKPYLVRKLISFWWRTLDNFRQLFIFPLDSMRAWGNTIVRGVAAVREGR